MDLPKINASNRVWFSKEALSVSAGKGLCFYIHIVRARVRRSQVKLVDFACAGTYNSRHAKTKEKERGGGRFGA